ncbi:MAG TPA: HNH endonuclease signature motif containing protein [Anaerolineae bacterium]|nr:HNH endonuclease signature motif containing protein [Anaerolineae bacterium]
MPTDIPAELRRLVFDRARELWEYCLLPQKAAVYQHEPDHIIPRQHDGGTTADNLALACTRCNRYKGPNIGSFDPATGDLVPFYNPRTQVWGDHFRLDGPIIQPLTPQGRVTVKILRLNDAVRVEERALLIEVGLYPQ